MYIFGVAEILEVAGDEKVVKTQRLNAVLV